MLVAQTMSSPAGGPGLIVVLIIRTWTAIAFRALPAAKFTVPVAEIFDVPEAESTQDAPKLSHGLTPVPVVWPRTSL
jgi:hypothetical protein